MSTSLYVAQKDLESITLKYKFTIKINMTFHPQITFTKAVKNYYLKRSQQPMYGGPTIW